MAWVTKIRTLPFLHQAAAVSEEEKKLHAFEGFNFNLLAFPFNLFFLPVSGCNLFLILTSESCPNIGEW